MRDDGSRPAGLTMLGADAPVCVDGVCEVPQLPDDGASDPATDPTLGP